MELNDPLRLSIVCGRRINPNWPLLTEGEMEHAVLFRLYEMLKKMRNCGKKSVGRCRVQKRLRETQEVPPVKRVPRVLNEFSGRDGRQLIKEIGKGVQDKVRWRWFTRWTTVTKDKAFSLKSSMFNIVQVSKNWEFGSDTKQGPSSETMQDREVSSRSRSTGCCNSGDEPGHSRGVLEQH